MNTFDLLLTSSGPARWTDANAAIADSMFLASVWFREHNIECTPDHLLKYAELVLKAKLAAEASEAD